MAATVFFVVFLCFCGSVFSTSQVVFCFAFRVLFFAFFLSRSGLVTFLFVGWLGTRFLGREN